MYVGNLSYSVTEDELRSMFTEYGDVVSAKLIMDRETGRSKGFGFVEMSNNSEAQKAMEDLNGNTVDGRALTVNQARPRDCLLYTSPSPRDRQKSRMPSSA